MFCPTNVRVATMFWGYFATMFCCGWAGFNNVLTVRLHAFIYCCSGGCACPSPLPCFCSPALPLPPARLLFSSCSCGLRSSSSALLPPACPPRPVCLACLPSPLLPLVASLLSGLWTGEGYRAESERIQGDPLRPVVLQGLTRRRPPPCASPSRCCQLPVSAYAEVECRR